MADLTPLDRLKVMLASTEEPLLSDDEIADLLLQARRPDVDGNAIDSDDWTPTYNLDAAASTGWEWKAGRATPGFSFGEDGQMFSRQQIFDHCMQMASQYRRSSGSATVEGLVDDLPDLCSEEIIR